jgi:hypothetical protein
MRIDEVNDLVDRASHANADTALTLTAEALNKAALIASDCGLPDLARRWCWQQFEIFQTASNLTAKTAKLGLQPLVNLGRLLTRAGQGERAHQLFTELHAAANSGAPVEVDGKQIDLCRFFDGTIDKRHELQQFTWAVLLADGTRALTSAGRWNDAAQHVQQHKGIGNRLLDGRQVTILARCADGDIDQALNLINRSTTIDPWERAISALLHALCLRLAGQSTSAKAIATAYLDLKATAGLSVFRTRLGLSLLAVIDPTERAQRDTVAQRVVRDAIDSDDAYAAWNVLSHASATTQGSAELAIIVERSCLHRGAVPDDILKSLESTVDVGKIKLQNLANGRG